MKPLPGPARRVADLPRDGLLLGVRAYRLLLKPWLGSACRFEPTCSAYALVALQQHGAARGSLLTGWRLLRCHPWCAGGCDPVPAHFTFKRQPVAGATSFSDRPTDPSRTLP
jgi:putative membrane protein insertion efficiency factor